MIVYVCRWCGYVLYRGYRLRSSADIVKQYGGRCPRCLSPLSKTPLHVEVEVARHRQPVAS